MSKATFVSSKWLGMAGSNRVFLSKCIADIIDVIAYLPTKYCTIFKYVHAKCAQYKQVNTSGLNHEKFVQSTYLCGGKY